MTVNIIIYTFDFVIKSDKSLPACSVCLNVYDSEHNNICI